MLQRILFILTIILLTTRLYAQSTWVPFSKDSQTTPTVSLKHSDIHNISFQVTIYGMNSLKIQDDCDYKRLSIPDGERYFKEGKPEVPVFCQLIAVPDCDDVILSVTPSNVFELSDYNVNPVPRYVRQEAPEGDSFLAEVFDEDKSVYSTDVYFPQALGEIVETGYVRSQKVVRVALYPVQFNPGQKTVKVFTQLAVSLTMVNPISALNKELGIFRNMLNHAALNYKLSGISASTKSTGGLNQLKKTTSGSVTRVTNLNLLVDPVDPLPVDYLIITHSSLFNSNYLTTLANHRRDYNGYDVVIVQVDASGASNDIYDFYSGTYNYDRIRDFIIDVWENGTANHTFSDRLGYIVLVGDAFRDDNTTVMLPSTEDAYVDIEDGQNRVAASDCYYACLPDPVTHAIDDVPDVMYGRISVGNETELSNVVSKIITYETNSPGSWRNNVTFMTYYPWFFTGCDANFRAMSNFIPPPNYINYAWRGFSADTEPANGRNCFQHHTSDDATIVRIPDDVDEIYSFNNMTGWCWKLGSDCAEPNDPWIYGGPVLPRLLVLIS